MSAVTKQLDLLAFHDGESLTDMAEAIADFMVCCPSGQVAASSTQLSAMAISLLLKLAGHADKRPQPRQANPAGAAPFEERNGCGL